MPRMRKKKNLEPRMEACAQWLEKDPCGRKGHWRDRMPEARQLRLELGCGKGRFTVETAARNPDVLFVAIERVADALVTAMERAKELELNNVVFICDDAARLSDMFDIGEVDFLYINFCDPWPSKKHAKRRLTYVDFLKSYRDLLPDGGQIHFKTDNKPLFQFSLTQFPRAGYELSQVTFDLHNDESDVVMTDFEAVFHAEGIKINRCVGTKIALPETLGEEPALSLLDYWQEGDHIPRGMDKFVLEHRNQHKNDNK